MCSIIWITVDREIFTWKILVVLNFTVSFNLWIFFNGGWLQHGRAPGAFLAFSLLWGIGRARYHCSCQLDIYLGGWGLPHKLIHSSSPHKLFFFHMLIFRSWSWPRNYFNSEFFLIYRAVSLCEKGNVFITLNCEILCLPKIDLWLPYRIFHGTMCFSS